MKAEHLLPLLMGLIACGGGAASAPPAETPPATASATEKASTDNLQASAEPASAATPEPEPSKAKAAPPKIEFPPHASVDAAMKAIPQGGPRMNMADDALRKPLLDLKRYDGCKVPRSTRVNMTVAVYDGAAVGLDLNVKPKNAKIEECIDGVVRSMTWDKVQSLNTVSVNF